MLRINRLTDYAIVLLARLGAEPKRVFRAAELSASTNVPPATVGKLLRALTRKGFLHSHRGVHGGYQLAGKPEEISLARVIASFEGPLGLTVCTHSEGGPTCRQQVLCPAQGHWQQINRALVSALNGVTLADLVRGSEFVRNPVSMEAAGARGSRVHC